jgi:hypothetical protein
MKTHVFLGLTALCPAAIFLPALSPPAALAQSGLSISQQPVSQTVVLGNTVTLQVGVRGAGPFTYQWQRNGISLPNNIISTVAGGWVGDDGLATNANLNHPAGVVLNAAGNLYIAEYFANRVRKVDTNGIITTVAGDGSGTYSGDGGAATNASLNEPAGVAMDALGNFFIADENNERIRKVDTNGIITTVAGGVFGYSGNGGPATNAGLATPCDVAVDAVGNLFIADFGNYVIRKVDINGIISTVAGIGESFGYSGDGGLATAAKMGSPNSVTVDASGNLFITDVYNNRIRKVATNGIITTVAGNGSASYSGDGGHATNASLNAPSWVALDRFGNLWIADTGNERIRMVGTNGIINTVAGDGTEGFSGDGGAATNASLGDPDGLELDPSGNLFIADWLNNRVRQVDTNGIIRTVAGSGAGGYAGENVPATDASLWSPYGVAVDVFGNIFIADEDNNRVRKVDTDGIITTVAGNGSNGYSGDGGQATNASVSPVDVAVDASGNIFIAEQFNNVIRKVQTNGIISTVAGDGTEGYSGDGKAATNASLSGPTGVAVDVFGNIFIADEGNSRIRKVGVNGINTTVAGNRSDTYSGNDGPATQAGVGYPNGVAVDASSNLFIAQSTHIRKVDAAGIITTVAGNGTSGYAGDGGPATEASLSNPANLTVDSSGNILFADTYTNRIRKVDINGIISTIAGSGSPGYSGDGGPATNASLAFPSAVAADPSGNILIADWFNNRVRKVAFGGAPTLSLENVSGAAGGGDYQVIITGPQGSVTSTVATVTVALPPLQAALNPALTALLTFSGAPGSLYVLQAASNLDTPINWQPIFTNVADSNGGWTFTDTNILGYPAIFYRITLP